MDATFLDFESIRPAVLQKVEAFCTAHNMSPARFGHLFAADNKFVHQLRTRGVGLTMLATVARRANDYAATHDET